MERYFPPFVAVDARRRARSVMTAYNSVDGSPATQNRRLLTDILKRDWGFTGFVISDASAHQRRHRAAHDRSRTRPSAAPARVRRRPRRRLSVVVRAAAAVPRRVPARADPDRRDRRRGVARAAREVRARPVRASVRRRRRAAAGNGQRRPSRARARGRARSRSCCSRTSADVLPLAKATRSVAVIGVDADEARLGGYSGPGISKVSILDGLGARPRTRPRFATRRGPAASSATSTSCRPRSSRRRLAAGPFRA